MFIRIRAIEYGAEEDTRVTVGRGEWGLMRLRDDQLYDLCLSPNIILVIQIKKNEMGGYGTCMEKRRGIYSGLVAKM